jgi:hypothetical protein
MNKATAEKNLKAANDEMKKVMGMSRSAWDYKLKLSNAVATLDKAMHDYEAAK